MSDRSAIEWTDATWNPIRGCARVSRGCGGSDGGGCYAEAFAHRFSGPGKPYQGLTRMTPHGPRWTGGIRLVPELLEEPLRWKRPRRVFVNSMGDLFHEAVPDDFLDRAFTVMARAPQHTFQVLTKRPERMRRYMEGCRRGADDVGGLFPWPNVWLGTSVEDQRSADERIPDLLATPAAVRFLSCEPLLERVTLKRFLDVPDLERCGLGDDPLAACLLADGIRAGHADAPRRISWVIVGGESGHRARPMNEGWARQVVRESRAAGVPVFVKQMGRGWAIAAARARGEEWCEDLKGATPEVWPEDLRVRELPEVR